MHLKQNAFLTHTFCLIVLSSILGAIAPETFAQIVPDNTLNGENSITTPQGNPNDILVTGGARRDAALFHSFQEFNINEFQQVYFTNPDGVFNILTRVTGDNISQILGTLGVNGNANFFLMNPNGIYFGDNAKLDLRGSFTATTTDSIFIDNIEFSATHPKTPPLLKININPGIQYGTNQRDRELQNRGNLAVDPEENLTLFGGRTINRGNLTASGGKIELLGTLININDNSQIDVSAPTEAGTILIGGDYRGQGNITTADRVYIGENVVILANAESAIGNGGKVIVWANEVTGFYGEIQSRGGSTSGDGGFVEVSGKEYLIFSGFVDVSAIDGNDGTILLDPRNITISPAPNIPLTPLISSALSDDQILAEEFSNANMNMNVSFLEGLSGDIVLEATENIIITPGVDLEFTNISSISLIADADNNGSGDFLMGQNNRIVTDTEDLEIQGNNLQLGDLISGDMPGESGSIFLYATGDISAVTLRSNSTNSDAGRIEIISQNGSIDITNRIDASSMNDYAAPVYIEAAGDIRFGIANDPFEPAIDTRGNELGGNITIISQNGTVSLSNSDLVSGAGEIDGGNITIVGDSIDITDSTISSKMNGNGNAGTIFLEGNESIVLNDSFLNADMAFGAIGLPGDILIEANNITLDNSNAIATSGGTENSGDIQINATSLTLQNDSSLEIFSLSDGGNINITAAEISLSDRSKITTETDGINGGNIIINAEDVNLRNSSAIFTNVRSATGIGGNIEINVTGFVTTVLSENSDIFTTGDPRKGDINISARAIFGFNTGEELTGESDILGTVEVTLTNLDELDDFEEEDFDDDFEDDESRDPFALRQPPEDFIRQCGIARNNEIAIAGRSGMRTNPSQILRGREIWQDRRDLSTLLNSATLEEVETDREKENFEPLTEARGWKLNKRGNIELVGTQALQNNDRCQINNHSINNE
ncbi:MAG: filamentous hemagglutinin N-terminal domain-containing protein [Cyanobacteria bacterium SBLK]|nr:filamentous hemagglutinin N-terminal domain-containing protein [Cyanobacteria bacterium SBLK]